MCRVRFVEKEMLYNTLQKSRALEYKYFVALDLIYKIVQRFLRTDEGSNSLTRPLKDGFDIHVRAGPYQYGALKITRREYPGKPLVLLLFELALFD